ncbi:hypothetical protein PENARI_c001G11396 [Penicillium arizonense]|uniref:EamA domain-containing protein n=1 Tax=Penicillium arizonense TaxID=1835702 RepID=A0A1F5LYC9_PENAI|nr:hypothetical protein PENARI_c001G11396 [Penicillium arizonense]OGE58118.1 hypothetical protein PENARI_c001G11396 [Penicillium arizonense]
MTNNALIPFLVTMMLVTGDMQCVRNCDSPEPSYRKLFEQPVIQTAQMFVGEMGCWLVVGLTSLYRCYIAPRLSSDPSPLLAGGYHPVNGEDERLENDDEHIRGLDTDNRHPKPLREDDERIPLRGWKVLLLAAPSSCDIAGTTLMNVGLLFVAASIYQMTRGALVLFVGLFSVIFLRRKLYMYQWSALFIVVLGVAVVGLSGALFSGNSGHDITQGDGAAGTVSHAMIKARAVAGTPEAVKAIIGVLLIAAAQIFTASQFVLEEWILEHYAMDPIQVVGWEGVFGFLVTLVGMVVMYFAVGRTEAGRYGYFDMKEGWRQLTSNRAISVSSLAIMVSIGGFNFFGLSVTHTVSATSRSTIDTCRTLFIWLVSLGLGWETFKWLQVAGFALLVYGTFLFNDIVRPPLKACLPRNRGEGEVLLPEDPIEHI